MKQGGSDRRDGIGERRMQEVVTALSSSSPSH